MAPPRLRCTLPRVLIAASLAIGALSAYAAGATATPVATRRAECGPGSLPEHTQGRAPAADYASGRAAKGYRCNTALVAHVGQSGGFKVLRYADRHGHVCAYFDSTLVFPKDVVPNAAEGAGVFVLDMHDSAHPVLTDTLKTPAMLSPHESLLLNEKRGLLVADMGYPSANPGFVDVYDVRADCRHPELQSSTPMGVLGHESGFAPDGRTFYVSSAGGNTLAAVDLTNPKVPGLVYFQFGVNYHGTRVSDDGNRLYVAEIGNPGLTILDVSQIQHRVANPKVKVVSHLTWPTVAIPQVPIPMKIKGHKYLFEVDEYTRHTVGSQAVDYDPADPVGAARIINIDDDRKPVIVSDIRLAVHQPDQRAGAQRNDPGANFSPQGYAGHYCSLPRPVDPLIVACSFIASGERVFDIRDPRHPREIAYFNMPGLTQPQTGGYAMSQAAWDLRRHEVWYSDGFSGFWVFRITNGRWPAGL